MPPQYMGSPQSVFWMRAVQSLLWWLLHMGLTAVFAVKLVYYWMAPAGDGGEVPGFSVEEGIIFGSLVQSTISTTRKFANLWVGIDPGANGEGHKR